MALARRERLFYLCALPLGHLSVDWVAGGLFILAPAVVFGGQELSPTQIGLLFAIRASVSSLFYIPAGIFGDSARRQGPAMVATFWWVGLAALAGAFAPNYWALVLAIVVSGVGGVFWHPMAMGAMVQQMPRRRAMAMGVHGLGGSIAEMAAPLLVGFLLLFMGWRRVLLVNSLVPLAAGIALLGLISVKRPAVQGRFSRADLVDLARIARQPVFLGLLLAMSLYSMSMIALMSMTPVYLKDVRGFSSGAAGLIFAALFLSGTVASPFVGIISDKAGRKPVALVATLIGGTAVWMMTATPETVSLVLVMSVAGLCLISLRWVLTAAALDIVGQREATVIGFLYAIGEGVGALGSLIAGVIGEASLDWSLAFAAILAFGAGGVMGLLPLRVSGRGMKRPAG